MGRGNPVYDFHRTARRRTLYVHLGCNKPRSILLFYHTYVRAPELRKESSVADLPQFPLDSYHMCFASTRKGFTVIQMSLCLAFGRYFVALLNPPIPRIDPSGRSLRRRSFRARRCTSTTNQINAQRDRQTENSRYSH